MNRSVGGPNRGWEFEYLPLSKFSSLDTPSHEFIVAVWGRPTQDEITRALSEEGDDTRVRRVVEEGPLQWVGVRLGTAAGPRQLGDRLRRAGVPFRYVASAEHGALHLGSRLPPCKSGGKRWQARSNATTGDCTSGCWSHGPQGVCLDRKRFGLGAGTRLAVIDDDAASLSLADVDAEVLINVQQGPRAQPHGTLMVGWAVGTKNFRGVAPLASPRLYCVPKPDADVVSVPHAIIQAAADGADVILCPSYLEGTTSPMLDDALEFASRYGRGGRGCVVVVPTGREAGSAPGATHVSWSLGFGEPASDPRVLCVAPGSRDGGWFLWKERRGGLRPFANRGPAVQFLSPGDDMTSPLSPASMSHAESSGASAMAAGVALLVLEANPSLGADEVASVLRRTAVTPADITPEQLHRLVDWWDILPIRRDADHHDAKHGYGRLHAQRACLSVSDPVCAALISVGEANAALRWFDLRTSAPAVRDLYSPELSRWMARRCLSDDALMHQVCTLVRHMRLVAGRLDRMQAHGSGSLVRQLALTMRAFGRRDAAKAFSEELDETLEQFMSRLIQLLADPEACEAAERSAWRLANEVFDASGAA